MQVHDWRRLQRVHEFQGNQQGLFNKLVWHPDNHWLCAIGGGNNGFILFHNMQNRTTIQQMNSSGAYVGAPIPERPWYRKRKVWVIAGGAAAVGIVLAVTLGKGSKSSSSVGITPGAPVFQ